ncbi:MAG: metallophosphoesterase family protein [Prosthecobacter sp.]
MSNIEHNNNLRWLHLSDFHTGKDEYAQRKLFGRMLDHVQHTHDKGFRPDFVFVTGDLANKGKTDEFEMFYNEFLLPLFTILGGDIEKKTYVVPGNHDVERIRNPFFSPEDICKSNSRFFDSTKEGQSLRNQILPRFESFAAMDMSASPAQWLSSIQGAFSQIIDFKGRKIGVVGINTAWLSKDNDDRHKLSPGRQLVEAALDEIANCDARIVLGHHPLDWFADREMPQFRALFGKHNVIYLHGHLHEVRGMPEDGSGKSYLAIQCGAGFETRESEVWKNGVIWAELDLETHELRLQPRNWNPNNLDWPVTTGAFPEIRKMEGSDWWLFASPEAQKPSEGGKQKKRANANSVKIPEGWQFLTKADLSELGGPLEEDTAIRFFNGATPTWQQAVSKSIPRRAVVSRLSEFISQPSKSDRPRVALLLAASGEGKSTVLLQTIYAVCNSDENWRVLRRSDETQPVSVNDLIAITSVPGPWLIVTDEADQVANKIFEIIRLLQVRGRGDVHFLVASRDTDWIAAKAYSDNWWKYSIFKEEKLRGLDDEDAMRIIDGWAEFGRAALGRLANLERDVAVRLLIDAAREEAKTPQGSFFGAMLTVRFGDDLHEHLKLLLQRLGTRIIPGGATLLDAVAYVAAIHSLNLEILSRPVLAWVLGCLPKELKRNVLLPMGEEAAATTTSQFVYTRHRRVAVAVLEVLSSAFGEDTDQYYEDLAGAALDAYHAGEYIPQLGGWRYDLAAKLSTIGRDDLAIRVSRAVLRREATNTKTMVKLASLYRDANSSEEAVALFRNYRGDVSDNRAFFVEWALSESLDGDSGGAIGLFAHALSDECAFVPPDNRDSNTVLSILDSEFASLFELYNNRIFLEGRVAVATIGTKCVGDSRRLAAFEKSREVCKLLGAQTFRLDDCYDVFQRAIDEAYALCHRKEIRERLQKQPQVTFDGLKKLIRDANLTKPPQ